MAGDQISLGTLKPTDSAQVLARAARVLGVVAPEYPDAATVERVARALAREHFARKRHSGACSKEERISWMTNAYWRNHISAARAGISAYEGR